MLDFERLRLVCIVVDFTFNIILMSAGFGLGYWIRTLEK